MLANCCEEKGKDEGYWGPENAGPGNENKQTTHIIKWVKYWLTEFAWHWRDKFKCWTIWKSVFSVKRIKVFDD